MGEGSSVVASRTIAADRVASRTAPVVHSHASVVFYTAGASRVEQNGEWKLAEGDVLLVPAGQPHRMLEMRRAEYWGLGFCVASFTAQGSAQFLEPLERVRDGASAVVHIPASRQSFLDRLFRELHEIAAKSQSAGGVGLDAIERSLLTLILAEVDRAGGPGPLRATGGGVVVDALRFIERNCLRRVTLEELATAVGRTPTYVTAALTRATGRSAGEWIVSGRMAEARRLLLHSDEMIEVVAERVGYADATHFIRTFRRAHGMTPAAWRAARAKTSRFD